MPVVLTLLMAHLMLVAAALWIPIVQSWSGCCLPSAQEAGAQACSRKLPHEREEDQMAGKAASRTVFSQLRACVASPFPQQANRMLAATELRL